MKYQKSILWTNRDGISGFIGDADRDLPVNKQVEAIVNMTPPKNQKHVCSFIGLVNYYRYMQDKRSHLLQP